MRKGILSILIVLASMPLWATHQRAAEITYTWLGGNSYEFTLTCYTYTPSPAGLQRDSLLMQWGDGSEDYVPRVVLQDLGDDYTLNVYKMRHDFATAGTYVVSMEDANRNYGVVNMQNSVNIPMYVETELVISPFLGFNNSVQLLNAPVDKGCVGKLYLHNPSAYDPDGDSLSYRLVPCKGFDGETIPSFSYPQASSSFEMDPFTGELRWENPVIQGEYNVAFIVEEWRHGVKIGSVIRDMQIMIAACDNNLPEIEAPDEVCVVAGEQVSFVVSASDVDMNMVRLTASGAPLELPNSPAAMVPESAYGIAPAFEFLWDTDCSHVRRQPYQMVFHAKDNGTPVSLTNVKTVNVNVMGPKVEDLEAAPLGEDIELTWSPYCCQQATLLRIYRKVGCDDYDPDACETGIRPDFQLLAELLDINATSYTDKGLSQGVAYCYRMVAAFHDGAESVVSDAVCASLKNDRPLMTCVSNLPDDLASGHVQVNWIQPKEIDGSFVPPYQYQLKRTKNGSETVVYEGADSSYLDKAVNLAEVESLAYRVVMQDAATQTIGESALASAVSLLADGGDRKVSLRWTESAPWLVDSTQVFRLQGNAFVKIGTTTQMDYTDENLENGTEYGYYVRTFGHYMLEGTPRPLVNYSAIVRAIAEDNEPPAPPTFEVETDCEAVANILTWQPVSDADLLGYRIYYSLSLSHGFTLLEKIEDPSATSYVHALSSAVVGCYYLTAYDEQGNLSLPSDTLCVDYEACPVYELPNVFTPNGDGINDVFVPTHAQLPLISEVKTVIFNRWGNVLLETHDPMINWDGRNARTGLPCADGVYFYVCDVTFQGVEGEEILHLQGSIDIRR